MSGVKWIIFTFIVWRLLLFFPPLIAPQIQSYRNGYEYTRINQSLPRQSLLKQTVFSTWANFDGVHYLRIAREGYTNNGRFLPLLPLVIAAFTFWNSSTELQYIIAWLVVQFIALLSLICLYKLFRLDYDRDVSRKAIIALLVFPTAFFLGSIYTEGLFLLLAAAALLASRKKNWLLASLLGSLLPLTRIVGLTILPALVYETFKHLKTTKQRLLGLLPLLLIIVSVGLLAWFDNTKWHDPLYFIHAHTELQNGRSSQLVFVGQTMFRYLKILATIPLSDFNWWIALLELASFLFASVMLIIAWKKKVPMTYIILSVGAFLIPVFSGTFSGLPRYILTLFPIYLAIALLKNNFLRAVYIIIAGILQIILLACFSQGYFVA